MKKVIIIGCPGAGKSTVARKVAQIANLPLIHLDANYHKSVWSSDPELKTQQWRQRVKEMVSNEVWIIDGNYKGTFDIRFPVADTVIFLDYSRWLCLWRAFKRRIEFRNSIRPDMPEEWKEKLSLNFIQFIWTYREKVRPLVMDLIKQYGANKRVEILRNPKEANLFIERLQLEFKKKES